MACSCDVAIVGGGIGGLVLARSLLLQSMSVTVFEQDTELREIGAGIALGGNAVSASTRARPSDVTGSQGQVSSTHAPLPGA